MTERKGGARHVAAHRLTRLALAAICATSSAAVYAATDDTTAVPLAQATTVAADGTAVAAAGNGPVGISKATGVVPADTSAANAAPSTPSAAWNQPTPWTQFLVEEVTANKSVSVEEGE